MQPLRQLSETLRSLADREHCVFAASDLAAAVPGCGQLAVLLSRATKAGLLKRVCKGIYLYPVPDYPAGNLLHHAAARLRAGEFNYLSLEIGAERCRRHLAGADELDQPDDLRAQSCGGLRRLWAHRVRAYGAKARRCERASWPTTRSGISGGPRCGRRCGT
jgi:hypothetical protein